ncbi:MAG TPA: hypothetical protein DCL77_02235 [Prolixibacteraceae bacterium]|nr:hypothetical protein [Prolixibacteraceae bacterium]
MKLTPCNIFNNFNNFNNFAKPCIVNNYNGYWACHIKPDWLLIWRQNDQIKVIELVLTGTHSDLFKG